MKKKYYILILVYFFHSHQGLMAQISIASNTFINKFYPNSSITEAGMDFQNELEFSTNEVVISVAISPQNLENVVYNSWQIHVSKNDVDWNDSLKLYLRRSGSGKSDYNNKPQNGTNYQIVDSSSSYLFEGNGWINSIPIQIKLTGLSVTLPAKSYTTDIIFTLIDN